MRKDYWKKRSVRMTTVGEESKRRINEITMKGTKEWKRQKMNEKLKGSKKGNRIMKAT